ncbi:MAG: hypothetical protein V6Z78_00815 [Holosporaceae bacterium]
MNVHVAFDGFEGDYSLLPVNTQAGPAKIAFINFREDRAIVSAAAHTLAKAIPDDIEVLITLGDQCNGLAMLLALTKDLPLVVLTGKPTLEGVAFSLAYASITSGAKKMFISPKQVEKIKGKRAFLGDDVISTGGSMQTALQLCQQAGATVQGVFCVCTEGTPRSSLDGLPLLRLCHFPVQTDSTTS